ncbi:eukaryotic translation initiation factor 3 subunit J [Coleophoma cylindrospora]|uniref:Eukaryotic translation initiation factor 3 subunit J n=1 Tax=Coleophoma cylindrospora TaxID=1849047 RepID=A0A3D8RT99_9HELO|nr:eukaryotic translation initiation factor 3 subunit J [Coleophoma cylindrospora]
MPPKKWDDEEDDSSTPPSSPPTTAAIPRRNKFDDEEEDSDVIEDWDAAEDSEVEREKAKVAAEKKAKADAEAAANKKSKAQRIKEKQEEKARRLAEESDEESEEDEVSRKQRLLRQEQESDLKHAEDLFGITTTRKNITAANAVVVDAKDPAATVDLTSLPLFDPKTKLQFEKMRDTLVPLLLNNAQKAHYVLFLQEFTKQIAKDLPSDQIKKIASGLTTLSNEKMKEEKAAEKGGKKSKAQKTKVALVASRNASTAADVNAYDDDFGE